MTPSFPPTLCHLMFSLLLETTAALGIFYQLDWRSLLGEILLEKYYQTNWPGSLSKHGKLIKESKQAFQLGGLSKYLGRVTCGNNGPKSSGSWGYVPNRQKYLATQLADRNNTARPVNPQ
ncbi:hypothetical protein PSTG_05694 [Puccinia striiformis f. sp. tritici PST-78]|uniref:Uncharacterized protein n=1 Tax=Puccinia striiformis f. sp. tritici PST-78 TaxID=1165861 RepID=A0A0L0VP62_9BASI|nr:hypothetical protein PSTG_05694 [Puccinia striiformis f. sp. tritici PST-78]